MLNNILIEGCDGVGKSFLMRDLVDEINEQRPGYRICQFHNGPYENDDEAFRIYRKQIATQTSEDFDIILWDRAHLSEFVYGTIHRSMVPRLKDFRLMDAAFAESAILVYAKPPYEVAHFNWASGKRDEYLKKTYEHRAVYDLYDYTVACITEMDHMTYDYTQKNDVCKALIRSIVRTAIA